MNFVKSFFICLSMFSTVPMIQIKWNDKNMKYILYFLPLIGILLGLAEYLLYVVSLYLGLSSILYATLSVAIIVLLTGGIHLDGYADTIDAIFCHGDIKKRRQVLSDAHTGAFAIIYTIIYFLVLFGSFENMYSETLSIFMFILIFTVSRISILFLITFVPSSVQSGLLYMFSSKENKKSLFIYALLSISILLFLAYILMGYKFMLILLLILVIISIILVKNFNKLFGGISGDLAGFSICIYEIAIILLCSISRHILWN